METNIISIGNSKGIIIPSKFLKSNGFSNSVIINIEKGKIIISPTKNVRDGWETMIKNEIELNGQPKRLLPDFFEDEFENDWTW